MNFKKINKINHPHTHTSRAVGYKWETLDFRESKLARALSQRQVILVYGHWPIDGVLQQELWLLQSPFLCRENEQYCALTRAQRKQIG